MKNAIVTGANGFLGSALVRELIKDNIHVVALGISFENSKLPESNLIYKIETRLDNIEELTAIIPQAEYDAFYHFAWAGVNGPEKADPTVQIQNMTVAMNCAAVAKKLNCKKFLCAGTVAERAVESLNDLKKTNGGMMYGVAKHCAHLLLETYCKNINLNFVWMQFSNIFGPDNKTGNLISYTISELKKGNEATFGPAMQPYDFIYVGDLISAVKKLGENRTEEDFYFIGSGNPRLLKDYLMEVGEICGREDLIKIGARKDDGIRYNAKMFSAEPLRKAIGSYVTMDFSSGIRLTLENY